MARMVNRYARQTAESHQLIFLQVILGPFVVRPPTCRCPGCDVPDGLQIEFLRHASAAVQLQPEPK